MDEQYTKEDLFDDMEHLRKANLIEIKGMNEDGEWLWGPTAESLNMSEEHIMKIIDGWIEEEDDK
jgi:hypothetical protein